VEPLVDPHLLEKAYFFGDIDTGEAEVLLSKQPPGTFMLRYSSEKGKVALSFVENTGKNKVAHARVRVEQDGTWFMGKSEKYDSFESFLKRRVERLVMPLISPRSELYEIKKELTDVEVTPVTKPTLLRNEEVPQPKVTPRQDAEYATF